jgi:putative ABC transporter-associated repeat protein
MRARTGCRWVAVVVAVSLAGAGVLALEAGTATGLAAGRAEEGARVLHRGSVDVFEVGYDARATPALSLRVGDDSGLYGPPGSIEADRALLLLPKASDTLWSGEGVPFFRPGQRVWWASEQGNQRGRAPWPGWTAEGVPEGLLVEDRVDIEITSVTGPGRAYAWQGAGSGLRTYLDSSDPGADLLPAQAGGRGRTNWAFTAPGEYRLQARARATPANGAANGAAVTSPITEYRICVGDLAGCGHTLTVSRPSASYPVGGTIRLGAAQTPGTGLTAHQWWVRRAGATTYTRVAGQTGAVLTLAASKQLNGARVKVALAGAADGSTFITESAPVLLRVRASAPPPSKATVLGEGHVDIASRLSGGKLITQVKDTSQSSTPVWRELADVVFHARDGSRTTVPAGADFEFLGRAGDPVWILPQTQQAGLLWPGWSTESIPSSATKGGVTWRLTGVTGLDRKPAPGRFALFEVGAFGKPHVLFRSGSTVTSFTIPPVTHAHGAWAFSKTGTYCLGFRRTATLASGKTVASDTRLAVVVGGAAPSVDPKRCDGPTNPPPGGEPGNPGDPGDPDPGGDPGPGPGNPGGPAQVTILGDGHVDLASRLDGRSLETVVKDTTRTSEPIWRDLRKTVFWARSAARTVVPEAGGYDFLGRAGSPVWLLPQTQQSGLLWPGWSTESLPVSATQGGVSWSLSEVGGLDGAAAPGEFALFEAGTFGRPEVLFNTRDGLGDAFTIPKNAHAHGSWAFEKPGTYCLAFTRSTVLADGTPVRDDSVLAVAVGDAAPTGVDPARCFDGRTPRGSAQPPVGDPTDSTNSDATPKPAGAPPRGCAPAGTSPAVVLSDGHVDYGTRVIDGALQSMVKDGTTTTTVWREPAATVLWLKPEAQVDAPGGAFDFLGAAGQQAWQVPQTQEPGLIWLGWNTEELRGEVAGSVTWTLEALDGPGEATIYTLSSFGEPQVLLQPGGTMQIPVGTHAHGNWGFTAEGIYRLRLTQTATLVGGGTSSDTETLTIAVGDVDPATGGVSATAGKKAADCAKPAPVAARPGSPASPGTPTPQLPSSAAPAAGEPRWDRKAAAALVAGNLAVLALITGGFYLYLRRRFGALAAGSGS